MPRPRSVEVEKQHHRLALVFSSVLNEQVRRASGAALDHLLNAMSRIAPEVSRASAVRLLQAFAWPPVPAESVVLPWPDLPDAFHVPYQLRAGRRWLGLRRRFLDIRVVDPIKYMRIMIGRSSSKTAMAKQWGPSSEAFVARFRRALGRRNGRVDDHQLLQLMDESILAMCPADNHGQYSGAETDVRITRVLRKFGIED